jgi:cobalt-zinc-cadmium efflux system protein
VAHGHSHAHGTLDRTGARRALTTTLLLTTGFGLAQAIGGVALGSVALIADSGHNLSDGLAIGLALVAARLVGQRAGGQRTFGWGRVEILAALVNGLLLVALGIGIAIAAIGRLAHPEHVGGLGMAAFGAVGIAANGAGVVAMARASRGPRDLNLRGALLHTAADVVASVGVLLAGVLVAAFGWNAADPIVALAVSALIVGSSWSLIAEPVSILLERAPGTADVEAIGNALARLPGVREVHDLHVWTITTGFDALSVHLIAGTGTDQHQLLHRAEQEIRSAFGITHSTIQVDIDHRTPLTIHRKGCPEAPKPRTAPLVPPDQR